MGGVVGRASNRKKAQRQAGSGSRQASQNFLANPETQQVMHQLVAGLQALVQETNGRKERRAAARRTWSGDAEPVPAEEPRWPEDSLGDRFFAGPYMEEARNAPSLVTAEIPAAAVIAADSAHWNVATDTLVRAVAFDGLGLDHPAVRKLLEVLAPIAAAELAYRKAADAAMYQIGTDWGEDEPEFPELDGPVFLLGTCVLVDAVWAAVGEDPLADVRGVLLPVLDAAVPGLDSQAVSDALIGAFSTEYCCEQPGDGEVLGRIKDYSGDALETLATAGAVPPSDVLPVGLTILSALARLCRSDSASVLPSTPSRSALSVLSSQVRE
jgi:hypothetical protein